MPKMSQTRTWSFRLRTPSKCIGITGARSKQAMMHAVLSVHLRTPSRRVYMSHAEQGRRRYRLSDPRVGSMSITRLTSPQAPTAVTYVPRSARPSNSLLGSCEPTKKSQPSALPGSDRSCGEPAIERNARLLRRCLCGKHPTAIALWATFEASWSVAPGCDW